MDPIALLYPHVALSLLGIAAGSVVMRDFLHGTFRAAPVNMFLVTTALTSATGYLFQRDHLLPSHVVGAIALLVIVPTWLAWRPYRLAGGWKRGFIVGATARQWFNGFGLVAQLVQKVPGLHALAPTGSEPPFAIAQGIVVLLFIVAGAAAWRRNGAMPALAY